MTLRLLTLFTSLVVFLAAPLAWAVAPPECESDEECQDWGFEYCDGATMECEGGGGSEDNFQCSSDAGCPEGESCIQLSSASYCQPAIPAPESDATGSGDATESGESGQDAGGDNGGCQGGDSTHGLLVLLAGFTLLLTRRRGAMS